ncbi:MAG: hypothetical protein FJ086_14655 [Deltaproteobacteria bacterium]|nr:hypothetical protein [Deltaproteobacteria bacterium]
MDRLLRLLWLLPLLSSPALAYPWMAKHDYGSCTACHVDPSGGGQLTPYGRGQADVLVRFRTTSAGEEGAVSPTANFLWMFELPDAVNLSGNFRGGPLIRPLASSGKVVPLAMASDLYATVNVGNVVAHVTTGVALRNAQQAAILPVCDPAQGACGAQWVSREFWAGAKFAEESVMVRAGRMNLPFGLRNNEHNSFVRALTGTDINLAQQVGLSASYNGESLRGEVMAIAGNFQVSPDTFRERGYSAFGEYALTPRAYVGASSLVTRAGTGLLTGEPTTRHAHGLFARYAPGTSLALLAEADLLAWQLPSGSSLGYAALVQADWEPLQGLHLVGTGEAGLGRAESSATYGAWASVVFYALPHVELRLDNILRLRPSGPELSNLLQLHFFL